MMAPDAAIVHKPVLLQEVLQHLAPRDGGLYIDCNLGLGGHSEGILEKSGPTGRVIGFDWDGEALERAQRRLRRFDGRTTFVHDNFAHIAAHIAAERVGQVDGILLDLGLSSLQLDAGQRGFSFKGSEPLDMRMDVRGTSTAASLLNTLSQEELADIFYYYGEEKQARRIATFVVEGRKKERVERTDQFVALVERAVPKRFWPKKIHVATRVFQALRIAVNQEFENLERVLREGVGLLKTGGMLCCITFHSLEDRLVKRAFNERNELEVVTKKPIPPSQEECAENPRSRSAKLRVARKKEALF